MIFVPPYRGCVGMVLDAINRERVTCFNDLLALVDDDVDGCRTIALCFRQSDCERVMVSGGNAHDEEPLKQRQSQGGPTHQPTCRLVEPASAFEQKWD